MPGPFSGKGAQIGVVESFVPFVGSRGGIELPTSSDHYGSILFNALELAERVSPRPSAMATELGIDGMPDAKVRLQLPRLLRENTNMHRELRESDFAPSAATSGDHPGCVSSRLLLRYQIDSTQSEEAVATINVRLLDDDVVRDLKSRAARNNRSLEGEVRHILKGVVKDDMATKSANFLRRTAELRRGMAPLQTPSEDLIREDRDHGH